MREWTDAQKKAIETTGRDIIVSAAAGSGKTSVLIERLFRRITDIENPISISDILVVTFTKAAAGELKDRIAAKINEELASSDSGAERIEMLSRQKRQLSGAKIGTIHSFCFDVVRQNFSLVGMNPTVRVSDATEAALIAEAVMDKLIDTLYAESESDAQDENAPKFDFGRFADLFVTDRDDALGDILIKLYDKIRAYPRGIEFISDSAKTLRENSEKDFFLTPWGEIIKNDVLNKAEYYRSVLHNGLEYFSDDEKLNKKFGAAFEGDISFIIELIRRINDEGYNSASEYVTLYRKGRIGSTRIETDENIEFYKEARANFTAFVEKELSKCFVCTDEKIKEMMRDSADVCDKLYYVLKAFDEKYMEEKMRRGLLDFGDLETLTLKLFINDDGNITDTAREYKSRFKEIYIDEYQDINKTQDLIFRSISDNNRFMVGDIKQSIYGFRGSEPEIFASYRNNFPNVNTGITENTPKNTGATVFLSNNFRSDKIIVDFVNTVFYGIMGKRSGSGIEYTDDDALVYTKKSAKDCDVCVDNANVAVAQPHKASKGGTKDMPIKAKVNVVLLSAEKKKNDAENDEIYHSPIEYEAEYTAREIRRLIDEEGFKPSDIKIIMRRTSSTEAIFSDALRRYGVGSTGKPEKNYFENPEILLMLCILNVTDNPTRDVYLAGALKSPIFGFTMDDLVKIRNYRNVSYESSEKNLSQSEAEKMINDDEDTNDGIYDRRRESLYESLRRYTSDFDFSKGRYFIEKLEKYREKSVSTPVYRLIWYIYNDIGAYLIGSENDNGNLIKLYEYARAFENGSFKGLGSFIRYLNEIMASKPEFDLDGENAPESDSVEIMTIHHSKGLEFPVCFIPLCGDSFSKRDDRNIVITDSRLGICTKLRDRTGFARIDTPIRTAAVIRQDENQIDEEMRLLYVALTRAGERLYVISSSTEPQSQLDSAQTGAKYLSRFTIETDTSYMRWILLALAAGGYNIAGTDKIESDYFDISVISNLFENACDENNSERIEGNAECENSDGKISAEGNAENIDINAVKEEFEKRFSFRYGNEKKSLLPSKLSVSKLGDDGIDNLFEDIIDIESDENGDTFGIIKKSVRKPDENESGATAQTETKRPRFMEKAPESATPAERGTATHTVMQFCDWNNASVNGIENELDRLVEKEFITRKSADSVYTGRLARFFRSKTFSDISDAEKIYRELRFNVYFNASELVKDEKLKNELKSEKILVQGVIDCLYFTRDGKAVLMDYKTDNFRLQTDEDREKAKKELKRRYSSQLGYYKKAARTIIGREPDRVYIYSFALDEEIDV